MSTETLVSRYCFTVGPLSNGVTVGCVYGSDGTVGCVYGSVMWLTLEELEFVVIPFPPDLKAEYMEAIYTCRLVGAALRQAERANHPGDDAWRQIEERNLAANQAALARSEQREATATTGLLRRLIRWNSA